MNTNYDNYGGQGKFISNPQIGAHALLEINDHERDLVDKM
jgi:hypothetical protein